MEPAPDLTRRKCRQHPFREAAARCTGCGRYYCRECVSEHRERMLCAECLRGESAPPSARRRPFVAARAVLRLAAGVLVAWLFFHLLGQVLLRLPDTFHPARAPEGAVDGAP